MKLIYIAGPISALNSWRVEQNIRKAEELALEVWKRGHAAICPHKNARHFEGPISYDQLIEGDKAMLRVCSAVLVVKPWHHSQGTVGEIAEAERYGIPVFYDLADLDRWAEKKINKNQLGD